MNELDVHDFFHLGSSMLENWKKQRLINVNYYFSPA